jgi:hypothetical protein
MNMEDRIKRVLEFDPLYEAEKALGNKHWSQFTENENAMSMGLFFLHNENKDKILKESKDTHFSMDWNEFVDIITNNGFKLGYEYSFPYEDKIEKAALFYRLDGLVIWVTSYWNGKSVNGGTLYGEIKLNDTKDRANIPSCSNGFFDFDNGKLHFDTDVREGLIWFINSMSSYGEFIKEWEQPHKFLWLLDFVENKMPNYNYTEISKKKINMCCDEVKNIMKKSL